MKRLSFIILGIPIFCLFSCSALKTNNIAPGYIDSYKAIKNALFGFEDSNFSPELIKNIPYASLLLRIGQGPTGLVILESIDGERLTWVSADGVYLVTERGRIIETRGLPNNLISTLNKVPNFKDLFNYEDKYLNQYYSYDKPEMRNLHVQSKIEVGNVEEVQILDRKVLLRLIIEKGSNEYLGWKFTNKYWIDENYFIWKSEQYISPKLPKINVVITKKPS